MGRSLLKSDCDELEYFVRKRNIVCSHNLLKALRVNHGDGIESEAPELPEPEEIPVQEPVVFIHTNKIDMIKRLVCKKFGVSKAFIESGSRKKGIVQPRQIGMYLARKHTNISLPEIGRRFGGRDHTTILHAFQKIEALIKRDESIASVVADLEAQFT